MKIYTPVVVSASALGFSVVLASLSGFRGSPEHRELAAVSFPSGLTVKENSDTYHMKPVHVFQARVEKAKPVWNADLGAFVSSYYSDKDIAFRAVLDSVNTASVEGALMYVQAEGINYATRGTDKTGWCARKNKMKYVVLYDMIIAQTNETLALYPESEYGKYLAFDGGQCTPSSGTGDSAVFPTECNYLDGTNGQPNVGPFVGGEPRDTDPRAPYPNTWWYSFPNSCPLKVWNDKTDSCRAAARGGLCPFDVKPDGVTCTYNYRILGWVPLDDLVGITAMKNGSGVAYADFNQFCMDDKVEFNATTDNGTWIDSIDFWKDPQNKTANANRATKLIDLYNAALDNSQTLTQVSSDDLANFKALPSIASLRAENPKCYENIKACATAKNGCKRDLYGQVCTVCEAAGSDCAVAPDNFVFPTLVKATPAPATQTPTPTQTPSTVTPSQTPSTTKSAAVSTSLVTVVASAVASAAISFLLA